MKNIKREKENTPSDYSKDIFQESNIFLSQHQPKNLLRLLSKSSISKNLSLFLNAMIKEVKYPSFT